MKKFRKLPLVLIACFLVFTALKCNDNDQDPGPGIDDNEPDTTISAGGIVARDDQNVVIDSSAMDLSDWGFEDSWTPAEQALFGSIPTVCNPHDSIFLDCYPNPSSTGELRLKSSRDVSYSLAIVDLNLNLVGSRDLDTNTSLDLNLSAFSGDTLRVYYIATEDQCSYLGHGDMVIE